MAAKKRGLGRGLDALLGAAGDVEDGQEAGDALRELPLDALEPGAHQPRQHFDQAALEALADSIRAQGVVQPIVVRPGASGRYQIVAGERRWRAARLAGLNRIPAVVRSMETRAAMAVALVENIQRADLNPLEEADALRRLIDDCGLTHEQAADAVGRSRTAVSNILRLLELQPEVQALVRDDRLSLGHAKVLLGAESARQSMLAQRVVALGLSVRQTEALVRGAPPASGPRPSRAEFGGLEQRLRRSLGMAVRIQPAADGGGRLVIAFKDRAALERLLEQMQANP